MDALITIGALVLGYVYIWPQIQGALNDAGSQQGPGVVPRSCPTGFVAVNNPAGYQICVASTPNPCGPGYELVSGSDGHQVCIPTAVATLPTTQPVYTPPPPRECPPGTELRIGGIDAGRCIALPGPPPTTGLVCPAGQEVFNLLDGVQICVPSVIAPSEPAIRTGGSGTKG